VAINAPATRRSVSIVSRDPASGERDCSRSVPLVLRPSRSRAFCRAIYFQRLRTRGFIAESTKADAPLSASDLTVEIEIKRRDVVPDRDRVPEKESQARSESSSDERRGTVVRSSKKFSAVITLHELLSSMMRKLLLRNLRGTRSTAKGRCMHLKNPIRIK